MHKIRKVLLLLVLITTNTALAHDAKLHVVTSFSILEDLTKELGGEHVSVVNLVARNSDAHMYHPKPSDAVAISKADLIIFNGLAFEGWITRLIENNGSKTKQLVASEGIKAMSQDGELDPHAWQSIENIRVYVDNISQMLVTLLPEHKHALIQRRQAYLKKVSQLEQELTGKMEKIPPSKRIVVTSHDAFGYLGREFNIQFFAPIGINLEVEATAADVANVIDQIREQNVNALFVENINNPRLLERISDETGVAIGGRLYSDALSEIDGPASTYLGMMKYNINSLLNAFNQH